MHFLERAPKLSSQFSEIINICTCIIDQRAIILLNYMIVRIRYEFEMRILQSGYVYRLKYTDHIFFPLVYMKF